ncbi:DUF4870 domain-containing protein [Rubellicoccus peritrichatus]|uniref:DUF4870 domain-containing protein n=1 Tax=Rubellicoccus peritrichatus TaxID=3080537 RepID=A0AAQ3L9F0_9BACT|nr:DUF4870 domain-containing protein [Puniceicoccus sp. CR14]WOO41276.1 DUF4870 domain-containing protein [Puniceicoccus sp. CR14]
MNQYQNESSIPPPIEMTSDEKLWAILSHISLLLGVAIILPLIAYLVKRGDSAIVAEHAKEALNFHISLLIYTIVCIPLVFIFVGIFLIIGISIASMVLCIIATIKASNGEFYRYPLTIRFVS